MRNSIILIVVAALLAVACKKQTRNELISAKQNLQAQSGPNFNWQENGGPVQSADSVKWSYASAGGIAILHAYKGTTQKFTLYLENNSGTLTTHRAATDPPGLGFLFTKASDVFQILYYSEYNVTVNSNNEVGGDFDFPVTNSDGTSPINRISATFNNVPYKP